MTEKLETKQDSVSTIFNQRLTFNLINSRAGVKRGVLVALIQNSLVHPIMVRKSNVKSFVVIIDQLGVEPSGASFSKHLHGEELYT